MFEFCVNTFEYACIVEDSYNEDYIIEDKKNFTIGEIMDELDEDFPNRNFYVKIQTINEDIVKFKFIPKKGAKLNIQQCREFAERMMGFNIKFNAREV